MDRRWQSETLSRFHGDRTFLAFRRRLDLQQDISFFDFLVAIKYYLRNFNYRIRRVSLYAKRNASHTGKPRAEI
jgi:hypothetical protein